MNDDDIFDPATEAEARPVNVGLEFQRPVPIRPLDLVRCASQQDPRLPCLEFLVQEKEQGVVSFTLFVEAGVLDIAMGNYPLSVQRRCKSVDPAIFLPLVRPWMDEVSHRLALPEDELYGGIVVDLRAATAKVRMGDMSFFYQISSA